MSDIMTKIERSQRMRLIRSTGTKPELRVRKLIHSMGYRYRLHSKKLLGRPDLVFPARRKIIFVHGCFWHGHSCRHGNRVPKSNQDYWIRKISGNRERDKKTQRELEEQGWKVFVIWECETQDQEALKQQVADLLDC